MLYDACIKNLTEAEEAMASSNKELEKGSNSLLKAQDIITELMASLDFERGGEIASSLFNLYNYFLGLLSDANIRKEIKPILEVRKHLVELREAWFQIQDTPVSQPGTPIKGIDIAG